MRLTPRSTGKLATATCLLLCASGCTFGARPHAASSITVTETVVPSAFVAVVSNPSDAPSLAALVTATARPGEHLYVLGAGSTATVLVAASSPPPVRAVLSGKPAAPGPGATPFQQAEYHRSLASWQRDIAKAKGTVAAQTHATLATWATTLSVARKVSHLRGSSSNLANECSNAADVLADLNETSGASFSGRRVLLIYAPNLDGSLPPGELTGDDVIVVTSFLPSAAMVSAAQAKLLAAGATQASILGPEFTSTQVSQLVRIGLSRKPVTEVLSGPALFANNSAQLGPDAAHVLIPLIKPLKVMGAAAVINGYASSPGTPAMNYQLSYARANAVAAFLEARGVPASSLVIVGHGSNDLVADGPSGANRRVVVVVEGSAAG